MGNGNKNKAKGKIIYFTDEDIDMLEYIKKNAPEYEKNHSEIVRAGMKRVCKSVEKKVAKLENIG